MLSAIPTTTVALAITAFRPGAAFLITALVLGRYYTQTLTFAGKSPLAGIRIVTIALGIPKIIADRYKAAVNGNVTGLIETCSLEQKQRPVEGGIEFRAHALFRHFRHANERPG